MDSRHSVSRRSFLKTAAAGSATLASGPAFGRILGANDRINVALIGVGCRGNDHLNLLLATPAEQARHRNRRDLRRLPEARQHGLRKAPGAKTYEHHQEVLQR